MSRISKFGSVIVMLALVLGACAAPGATTRPSVAASPTAATPTATATNAPSIPPATDAPATDAPATDAPIESPGASPSPTPPPAAEEGTLTLWVDETRAPIMIQLGADFETATGVPVAVHQVGFGDIRDQLQLRGPAGEGPDIIIGAHDWLGQLATNGLVEPLDLGAAEANLDTVAVQAMTYDGVLYGMPYAAEAIALYINPDLVPVAPTTWDELIQMATDLQADESLGLEQAYVLQEKDPYHSYPLLTANGGYIFAQDDAGTYDPNDVGLDSEGGLAYGTMLDQMVKDGLLRAGVNYDTMIALFTAGDSAMFMTGPWALPQIRESGVNFDVVPIPAGDEPARPFVGVQGFMVSAFSPNKVLAQTFLTEYVATDETFAALFEADPRPSTWLPQAAAITDEDVLAFIESASNGDPLPAIPEMSAVWTDWTDALDLIFTQGQEPDAAMTDAAESIRAIIAAP